MKKILIPLLLLLSSLNAWAQDAPAPSKTFLEKLAVDPLLPLYVLSVIIFIVLILALVVMVIMLRVFNLFIRKAAEEKAKQLGITYVAPPTVWEKFWQQVNASVPLEEEKNIELDHNYDGIRELDNHLPPWWKGLFYGTIVFAVIYLIVYHVSDSFPLSTQEYEDELSIAREQERLRRAAQPPELIDENTLTFTADADLIARGKQLFVSNNCQSCHRNDAGGNSIGPNLTDEYWLHGGAIKNVYLTIKNGVVEKAMPAWGKVMSQKDVKSLTFYIMSLQGTNPPNPKKPQGELYKPAPTPPPSDSTKISLSK